jgi:hypothetical protein
MLRYGLGASTGEMQRGRENGSREGFDATPPKAPTSFKRSNFKLITALEAFAYDSLDKEK